jgi:hypothetical protein
MEHPDDNIPDADILLSGEEPPEAVIQAFRSKQEMNTIPPPYFLSPIPQPVPQQQRSTPDGDLYWSRRKRRCAFADKLARVLRGLFLTSGRGGAPRR